MTHPHGLTRQDVAHLKAGDEVTAVLSIFHEGKFRVTSQLMAHRADDSTLKLAGWNVICQGEPLNALVEVISPKPPTPQMDEPTWLGAVVMTDDGLAISCGSDQGWYCLRGWNLWDELRNPRPLTDAERRDLGIPATLPDGWVAVDASLVPRVILGDWLDRATNSRANTDAALARVARAELARREATA